VKMDDLVPEAGNLESFIKQFEVFARAPGGVDELRDLILQLAVTGKLVPQNSTESSANLLVESIKATKAKLLKAKSISKQSIFLTIPDQDKPFSEPAGWVFVRLGEVSNRIGSGSTPRGGKSAYTETGIPFFRSQNVWNNGLKLHDVAYIPDSTHEKMSNTAVYAKDILLNITGASLGRCALIPNEFKHGNVSQHVTIIRATEPETRKYLHLCILSPHTQDMIWKRQVGMAREGLSKKVLEQFEIPLPPLEEQKRIVAKVDELMALCDTLEAQQQQQAQTVLRANTAAINSLLNPAPQSGQNSPKTTEKETSTTPENSFEQNWQRIAQHFNTLYGCTLPMPKGQGRKKKYLVGLENVKALRQVILKLAVTGFLTHRGDGSANKDLEALRSARQQLERTKVIRKYKVDALSKKEIGFVIPKEWEISRLGEITDVSSGSTPLKGKMYYYEDGSIPWVTSSLTCREFIDEAETLITPQAVEECGLRIYKPGTLLLAMYGQGKTRGQVTELRIPATTNQACAAISFFEGHDNLKGFIKLVLWKLYDELRELADGGAQPNLNGIKVKATAVPFPPLEEQKRIVTKVDQLMTLCDQLEQQLTQSYSDAEKLMQATVKALVA